MAPSVDKRGCVVCSKHPDEDRTSSLALVLATIEAAMTGDNETTQMLFENSTALDAHVACSTAANYFLALCKAQNADPLASIQGQRAHLASYVASQ